MSLLALVSANKLHIENYKVSTMFIYWLLKSKWINQSKYVAYILDEIVTKSAISPEKKNKWLKIELFEKLAKSQNK